MAYIVRAVTAPIPQSEPLNNRQVKNSAGGYSYQVDPFQRLARFLVLGAESGSFYASERTLVMENVACIKDCLAADGPKTVDLIRAISVAGRAPKADPALYALACALAAPDQPTRQAAYMALPQIARTGTHLFHLVAFLKGQRGWSRGLRAAVARWFTTQNPEHLAYELVKYRQRDGWSTGDVLRLAHPQVTDASRQAILHWAAKGWEAVGEQPHPDSALRIIWAHERLFQQQATLPAAKAADLIASCRVPREGVPSEYLTAPEVWHALLPDMPTGALIRNLATMTRLGVLTGTSDWTRRVVDQLADTERLRRARVHPIGVLSAMLTYASGKSVRGSNTWQPVPQIVDALDRAFYASFGTVEPTGKRIMLAIDISGSMGSGEVAGVPGLSPRVAAAALALVTANVERQYTLYGFGHTFHPLAISPRMRLNEVVQYMTGLAFERTDCALPMVHGIAELAKPQGERYDGFVSITDSETWYGPVHPAEALRTYRQKSGIAARNVVVGMVANDYTVNDPQDPDGLDVVGFDSATPQVISDFIAGRI